MRFHPALNGPTAIRIPMPAYTTQLAENEFPAPFRFIGLKLFLCYQKIKAMSIPNKHILKYYCIIFFKIFSTFNICIF